MVSPATAVGKCKAVNQRRIVMIRELGKASVETKKTDPVIVVVDQLQQPGRFKP
jgi:hypothetical protein